MQWVVHLLVHCTQLLPGNKLNFILLCPFLTSLFLPIQIIQPAIHVCNKFNTESTNYIVWPHKIISHTPGLSRQISPFWAALFLWSCADPLGHSCPGYSSCDEVPRSFTAKLMYCTRQSLLLLYSPLAFKIKEFVFLLKLQDICFCHHKLHGVGT